MRWRRDLRRRIDRQHGLAFLSDDAVLKAFKANVPAVRAEQGLHRIYGVRRLSGFGSLAPHGDDTFVVIEEWESASPLKAHAKAPQVLEYQTKVKDLSESCTFRVVSPA
jgi:quinol monooxygenase YgiN